MHHDHVRPKTIFTAVGERIDGLLYRAASLAFRTEAQRRSGRQFIAFGIIGVTNTAIDLVLYTWLTRAVPMFDYRTAGKYPANVIAFLVATTFSFYANRTWTFRRKGKPPAAEVGRFYATTLSGLTVNTGLLFIFSTFAGMNDLAAKVLSTVFSMVWNFAFTKMWVFAEHREEKIARAPKSSEAWTFIAAPEQGVEIELEMEMEE